MGQWAGRVSATEQALLAGEESAAGQESQEGGKAAV